MKILSLVAISTLLVSCQASVVTPVTTGFADVPRGTPVTLARDAYGAWGQESLEDVYSYLKQGDKEAIAEMMKYPGEVVFAPAGAELVFEGCYMDDCTLLELRQTGDDSKMVFYASEVDHP